MFEFLNFDPKSMSDDELMQKQLDLAQKLIFAKRVYGSIEMVSQLERMIAALDFERRERYMRDLLDKRDKAFPEIIETEPDLKKDNIDGKKSDKDGQRPDRPARKEIRPIRVTRDPQRAAPGTPGKPDAQDDPGAVGLPQRSVQPRRE